MVSEEILFIIDDNHQLLFDGKAFKDAPSKKLNDYYSAAVLPSSLIRTHGFKAPKETSPEKLEIQAEMSMYEDGGLDPETDFKVASLTIPLEFEENLYVESYAIEEEILHKEFDAIAKKNHQIDAIFPPALSYSALYAYELLERKNDLFIHFDEHNAYAVIFKDGHYISTRVITTLDAIAQKLGIEVSKVREYLATKGVENDLYTPDEFLHMTDIQDELSKVVERVAHAVSHKRGVFRLETIDRFFLDFEGSNIPGFLEMFDGYGYEDSSKQVLNTFETVEVGNRHHAVQALYALGALQEKYVPVNLSIYERKPSFFKTHVGQFTLVMASSLLLALAFPIYASLELEKLNVRNNQLQDDVTKMETLTKKLRLKLKQERQKRDQLKEKKSAATAQIEGYGHMLDAVKDFDLETLSRQKMMKDVNIAMRQFKLSSKYLEQNSSTSMKVQIITKYEERDNIAKFMKQLISKGYSYVHTKKIERDDNLYESLVEIRP